MERFIPSIVGSAVARVRRLFGIPSAGHRGIRTVYFGLRVRFLALLCLIAFVIITVLTALLYFNQRERLAAEKAAKAMTLTRILGESAEFYLDRVVTISDEERTLKYNTMKDDALNFKRYNSDIVKVMLADDKGLMRYSTDGGDYSLRTPPPSIAATLAARDEELKTFDFAERDKRAKKKTRYRVVCVPILLHRGNVVDILGDFTRYYDRFQDADRAKKRDIYLVLWQKYRATLGAAFDPAKNRDEKPDTVSRMNDIDFVFLRLFGSIMISRDKRIKSGERWLWSDEWLFAQKKIKLKAYRDDAPAKAKEAQDVVVARMRSLARQIEDVRRLGALAVMFNFDIMQSDIDRGFQYVIRVALIMVIVSAIAFLIMLTVMIRNIKTLERWALSVAGGDLSSPAPIRENDEIGRLRDVFTYMLGEMKAKYHLEKYVSASTRAHVKAASDDIELGTTGRKQFAFLFSDVRGFTSFSEKNDPSVVVEVLNLYLELQSNIIKKHRGDIDDYVGDQIMAHFSGEHSVDRALQCASDIIDAMSAENRVRGRKKLPTFDVGIGVHAGDVVVGNIGSRFRMDFACIGDTVNLGSRLCANAPAGEIIVSAAALDMAKERFRTKRLPPLTVKGKAAPIAVVRLLP
ncbi:MAG: adenylate/guanylate cyclase domain-containing protein [Spirochaetota bacterium]